MAAELRRLRRRAWGLVGEPLQIRGWRPPVTVTLAWNLAWVVIYALALAGYTAWELWPNAHHERLRSLERLERQMPAFWADLYATSARRLPTRMALPASVPPAPVPMLVARQRALGREVPRSGAWGSLWKLVEATQVSRAFFLVPGRELALLMPAYRYNPRAPRQVESVWLLDRVDLRSWRPSPELWNASRRGPYTRAWRLELQRRRLRDQFILQVLRAPTGEFSSFVPVDSGFGPAKAEPIWLLGDRRHGFLGYQANPWQGSVVQDVLYQHELHDVLVRGEDTTHRTVLHPPHELGARDPQALLVREDGLKAFDDEGNRHLLVALVLGLLVLGLRANAAARDLRTLWRQQSEATAQSNFVSAVSHEMRTPLTTIQLYAEMLQQGLVSDPARREHYLATIASEGRRLGRLVENVLDHARVSGQRKAYHFEPVDARELLDEAIAAAAEPLARAGLTVERHAPVAVVAHLDRDAVVQSLINLLGNAAKYAFDGKQVLASAIPQDGQLVLAVQDLGPGIPLAEQGQVFKPFYRVGDELTRTTQGVGLGLALVEETARAHHGRVELESQPGHGCTFRMRLPLGEHEVVQPPAPPAPLDARSRRELALGLLAALVIALLPTAYRLVALAPEQALVEAEETRLRHRVDKSQVSLRQLKQLADRKDAARKRLLEGRP